MAYQTTKDFLLEVIKGKVSGHSVVRRQGVNPDVDTASEEDVWSQGGTYPWRTSAATVSAVSSSADDDSVGGTGARTMKIWGLDGSWAEINSTVSLDGTSLVNFPSDFMMIDRCEILTTGTGETNAGEISCAIGGTTHAKINTGFGHSQAAIYQIPAGKTGYLISWSGSLYKNVAGSVEFRLMTAEDGVGWAVRSMMELNQSGAGVVHFDTHDMILALPAKTRIKVRAKTSADNMGVISTFTIILV